MKKVQVGKGLMIHKTAIIDPDAKLGDNVKIGPHTIIEGPAVIGDNVKIGPFSIIEGPAVIGENTRIEARVSITGYTRIGKNCLIHVGAVLGTEPQDLSFKPSTHTTLEIGDHNEIREHVTIHRATKEGEATSVGSHNLIMAQSHIAHDCKIHNHVIIANNAMVAGHVEIGDRAYISGGVPIHQFVRVGCFAFLSGWTAVSMDVPPFMIAQGPNSVRNLNFVGLRRTGVCKDGIRKLRQAFKVLYKSDMVVSEAVVALEKEEDPYGHIAILINFINESTRGICRYSKSPYNNINEM